jgi:hypothetical protein
MARLEGIVARMENDLHLKVKTLFVPTWQGSIKQLN